jgi:RNA polymerase sigma factor (sigma-70 family)
MKPPMNTILKQLHKVLGRRSDSGVSDDVLLGRYLSDHDQAAFELLVWRYHRMVLGVCRRILDDPVDVEDAFQATFLVLARRAGAIRQRASLSSFLYGAARRVALEAAGRNSRWRKRQEAPAEEPAAEEPGETFDREELRRLLDEELGRLPEKYRVPLVQCYLEGATYDEVAERLGWPKGTVSTRLNRAREMLRLRLVRRGVTLSAAMLAGWLSAAAAAEASAALVTATARTATTATACAARVASLTDKVVRAMFLTRLKIATALVLSLALLGAAGASLAYHAAVGGKPPADDAAADKKPAKDDREALQGSWVLESLVRDGARGTEKDVEGKGWVVKGDRITLKFGPNDPTGPLTELTYTLDQNARPKTIDYVMVPPREREGKGPLPKWTGIYKLEGDRLTMAVHSTSRPTDFESKKGSRITVFVYKRGELPEEKKKDDRAALLGSWIMESVDHDGTRQTEKELDGKGWVVEKDRIIPKHGRNASSGNTPYTIDPSAKPKTIDMVLPSPDGKEDPKRKMLCIYKLEGDRLTVAMGSGERPAGFEARKGSKTAVYVFRRGELPERTRVFKEGDDAPKSFKAYGEEIKRLAGTWEQVSLVVDGAEVPLAKGAKARITISGPGTKFTVQVGALPVSPVVSSAIAPQGEGHFVFNPNLTPKWVAVYHEAKGGPDRQVPWTGVYELDGDTLRMCLAPPGKRRATKLESKEGSGLSLEVWKRVKE